MTSVTRRYVLLIGLMVAGLVWGGAIVEAIIGRPATPVSYAGVARRTTRRTVAVTSPNLGGPVNRVGVF